MRFAGNEIRRDIHRKKQWGAIMGAGVMLVLTIASVVMVLWDSRGAAISIWALLLLVVVSVAMCVGVVAALVGRIKEIRGGEEDEASKY